MDIFDIDCTKISPCKGCYWHIQGIEKDRCIPLCQKLSAYRDGLEYDHLPWPELKDLQGEETEDKIPPKNTKHKAKLSHTLQKKEKTRDSMPDVEKVPVKRNEDDEDDIDWKKGTCVICKDKSKKILNKRSQTCASCYQAWNMSKIDHPTLGHFEPSLTKSKIRIANSKVCVDPPIPGPQKPNRDKVFKIYMSKYPEIAQYIVETAEKSLLPAKHIFIQLLSEAIIVRKGKANK
jgi:hypothetical protein